MFFYWSWNIWNITFLACLVGRFWAFSKSKRFYPNRNSSRLQCFLMVSRKTRRVSKVNKGGQLPEVGFDKFPVNKWLIIGISHFAHIRKAPQIGETKSNIRGVSAWTSVYLGLLYFCLWFVFFFQMSAFKFCISHIPWSSHQKHDSKSSLFIWVWVASHKKGICIYLGNCLSLMSVQWPKKYCRFATAYRYIN